MSTKPSRLMPYSGWRRIFEREQLGDVAGADDDRVLHVGVGAAHARAGHGAGQRDEHDRRDPEGEQLRRVRVGEAGHPGERDQQEGADGDEQEHARRVVDRRVVGVLLVAVVEAEQPREHEPERERDEEAAELEPRAYPVHRVGARPEDQLCQCEREHEPGNVGREERPADDPAAPVRGAEAPAADQLAGALVDEVLERDRMLPGSLDGHRCGWGEYLVDAGQTRSASFAALVGSAAATPPSGFPTGSALRCCGSPYP